MDLDANLPFLDARSMSETAVVRQLTDGVHAVARITRALCSTLACQVVMMSSHGDAATVVSQRTLSIVAGTERGTPATVWTSDPNKHWSRVKRVASAVGEGPMAV